MMRYRDMTFCSAPCANATCDRRLTDDVRDAARRWWGKDGAPIAVQDMREGCADYVERPAP